MVNGEIPGFLWDILSHFQTLARTVPKVRQNGTQACFSPIRYQL